MTTGIEARGLSEIPLIEEVATEESEGLHLEILPAIPEPKIPVTFLDTARRQLAESSSTIIVDLPLDGEQTSGKSVLDEWRAELLAQSTTPMILDVDIPRPDELLYGAEVYINPTERTITHKVPGVGEIVFYPSRNTALSPLLPEAGEIPLRRSEANILRRLISKPHMVHSKEKLAEQPSGTNLSLDHLKTRITHLRQTLGENPGDSHPLIETVRGIGYKLAG